MALLALLLLGCSLQMGVQAQAPARNSGQQTKRATDKCTFVYKARW
jgi:hypothetical protein